MLRATEILGVPAMVTTGDLRGIPNLLLCLEIQLSPSTIGSKCAEAASSFCSFSEVWDGDAMRKWGK